MADHFQAGIADHGLELLFADDADVVGLLEILGRRDIFLQVFGAGMRDAQQIQRARFADAHQFSEELGRIVHVLDDLGRHHPRGGRIGNRQRVAVGDMAFDVAGRCIAQALAGRFNLGRVDIGDDDLRPAHPAEMHVAAVAAANIQQRVLGGHRESAEQFAGLLIEPAAEHRIVQAEHVRVDFLRHWRRGRGLWLHRRGRARREFLQKAQHEVAPEDVTAVREVPRRLTSEAPRLRMGISMTR
ncbi:hypothetical protein D3C72_1572280 [compost metagenome]